MQDSTIWTEKYRPTNFDEIVGQDKIVERARAFVEQKNMPNLLFAGPPGVGKSTLALVIARELYSNSWRENVLELNASVTGDTPILIKKNEKIKRTNFDELASTYFLDNLNTERVSTEDLEVLSIKNHKIQFSKTNYLFRHFVDKIAKIKYEGGEIKTSLSHSLMTLNKKGEIIPKKAQDLKNNDFLITFKTKREGNNDYLDLTQYKSPTHNKLRSGLIRNPKLKANIDYLELNQDTSWSFGLYTAEGCTGFNGHTSGQTIFTLGFPKEIKFGNRISSTFDKYKISTKKTIGYSGFNRNRASSIQYRLLNTQLAKFFKNNFYNKGIHFNARSKRIPSFLFETSIINRLSFLRGYFDGDGSGQWGSVARISSTSKECLIDTTWLSRISGLESSYFDTEARIIWKNPKFSYIKSELLPASLFENIVKKTKQTYKLRHFLYGKSSRITKNLARSILKDYKTKDIITENLTKLIDSDLSVLKITNIKIEDYNNYVYDVSVPESQTFFGGTTPILLHNSDDRGIDVVRHTIKDFSRTKAIANVPYKIIFLDECDSLTKEAQHALRRTMENYTNVTRFILSCNYSSKIIDPIISRCSVFRFKPIQKEDIKKIISEISKNEKLKISDSAKEALIHVSNGDIRKLQNILQMISSTTKDITDKIVYEVIGQATPKEIQESLILAIKGNFISAREKLLDTMLKYGLSGIDIIKQIQKEIWDLSLKEEQKLRLIDKCAEIEFRMVEGSDEFVQLEALLSNFIQEKS